MEFIKPIKYRQHGGLGKKHIGLTNSPGMVGHNSSVHAAEGNGNVPVHLVSFVEGTRLTLPKLEAAKEYARSRGLREPLHTLVPRTKGFVASVEGLRSHIAAVYDITIGYEDGVPSLWQYIKGLVSRIHVHVRRFPVAELPVSSDDLKQWLLDRWHEKDELLEHFYQNGAFPEVGGFESSKV